MSFHPHGEINKTVWIFYASLVFAGVLAANLGYEVVRILVYLAGQ